MIRSVYTILFLFFLLCANAQSILTVEVAEAGTGKKIPGVELFVSSQTNQYVYDGKEPLLVELGNNEMHELIFFSFEYETKYLDILLSKDTSIVVTLEPISEELNAILISGKREELFALKKLRAVEGTSIFSGKKTELVLMDAMMGNLASNNARQIYSRVAGINNYDASDGGIQLNIGGRGLDPNRSANFNIRQNGYDISADVLGYPESYYTPPADAIEQIQIVRGAASLQYGTQFGGLINFKLKQAPSYDAVQVRLRQSVGSYGLINSFNSIALTSGNWRVYSYYNKKTGNGFRPNSEFDSDYAYVNLTYSFKPGWSLSLEHSYFNYLAQQAGGLTDSQFESDAMMSTRSRNWFDVLWHLTSLNFNMQLNPKLKFSSQIYTLNASRKALGFRGIPGLLNSNPITVADEQDGQGNYIYPRDLIEGDFKNIGVENRLLARYDIGFLKSKKAHHFLIGMKYYRARNAALQGPASRGSDADFSFNNAQFADYPYVSDFDFPNNNVALFAENILNLSDKLSITPGIRYEFIETSAMGVYNDLVFDNAGNVLSQREINEDRTYKRNFMLLGIGGQWNPAEDISVIANISQNYRSITFSDIRVVNPGFIIDSDIDDESGYTIDLNFQKNWSRKARFELGLFTVAYNDRIGIIFDNRANRVRKNVGDARIWGLECLTQINIDKILQWNRDLYSLSLFSNLSLTESEYVRSEENNVVGNRVEFVPLINYKAGLQCGYKNLECALQWSYISRQYTDGQNSEAAFSGDIREGLVGPIPSYDIFDMSFSYSFGSIGIDAGINNLFDKRYFTQRATGYPGPGIIPSYGRNFYVTLSYDLTQSINRS